MRLFDHAPNREDALLAEALGLLDDGLSPEFVAALYPDDEEWLAPLLGTTASITAAYDAEPSYFFEASLKSKVLAAARDRSAPATPAGWIGMMRGAAAGATVVMGAALFGVLTLGFVTADRAVPGDWNYTFKLAGEQFRYTVARGDERIDLQIEFTENRVAEINRKLASGGAISPADVTKIEREARELAARFNSADSPQDAERSERLAVLGEMSATVLTAVREREVTLQPQVAAAISTVNEAVVAGQGGTSLLPNVTPTATATSTASEPAVTETTEPTAEPVETATPETPTPTPTPEPPTPSPEPPATAEPSPTPGDGGSDPLETPGEDNEFAQ